MFATPAAEYMSRTLRSVRPDTPLQEIARVLDRHDISSVPVLDEGGAPVGIVSRTDLLRAAFERPNDVLRARDVMQTAVIGVEATQPIRDAAQAMVTHRIHRVLAYSRGRAVGVVSTRDVMRAVLYHRVERVLAEVMTTPVATVAVGDSIATAIALLGAKDVHGLVVADGDFAVGIFTQAEALQARALPPSFLGNPVEEVMSYAVTTLPCDAPLYRVAGHAIALRSRRVVAVEGRSIRGIATGFDVARAATLEP